MKRSLYYKEKHAAKSNSLTSVGLTIVIIIVGTFLLFYGICKTYDYLAHDKYVTSAKAIINTMGGHFSSVHYVRVTNDHPSYMNAHIHLFKITNFQEKFYSDKIPDAYVKIELSDDYTSWPNHYISYSTQAD